MSLQSLCSFPESQVVTLFLEKASLEMRLVKTRHRRGSSSSCTTGVVVGREETQTQTWREDGLVVPEAEPRVTRPRARERRRLSAATTSKEEAGRGSLLGPPAGALRLDPGHPLCGHAAQRPRGRNTAPRSLSELVASHPSDAAFGLSSTTQPRSFSHAKPSTARARLSHPDLQDDAPKPLLPCERPRHLTLPFLSLKATAPA